MSIDQLWESENPEAWEKRIVIYWTLVPPQNLDLERRMEWLHGDELRRMDAEAWYNFLHDEYFRWKYTAANRYATTTAHLESWRANNKLTELLAIRDALLCLSGITITHAVQTAAAIPGLGTAGATGLIALIYPSEFGTVDQFVVKALRRVPTLPERDAVHDMDPDALTPQDAVLLITIMRRKAVELTNRLARHWTPRLVDKVLWTYGR